ncbi:putative 2-oxoglutarate dehydrogenase E1 component DHKTD1, mitochondrial [Zancudomyces culisetae]|uniref:Putative 2-oxoglutarate dehydrogenase E1 component DHKTD1, mitochondrial n=1 Tax=Zancudomyces culisetae TaxID=1213189 RepID=A0A1R1PEZ0_ZANCU|nr:putative 2-oxoglutarate dehydrogenase E1 component DHKTD1, mitochondrial [Zancudomyces culisetae]OMH82100.1 putative 2-oxoglutarate dehydrogenase E1 component DHKTD1, mitochondrial [Zancudomyces culisetae]|eukprot:OMH79489.1 putative 2-oxoglutarate dehydrogenase E1 component DHKTD1, mitochondrial [Zancudomyces culisetae]
MLANVTKNNIKAASKYARAYSSRVRSSVGGLDCSSALRVGTSSGRFLKAGLSKPQNVTTSYNNVREYHMETTYGYRVYPDYEHTSYNQEQLKNRQENSNLVRLIDAFRDFGHAASQVDPLGIHRRHVSINIEHERYGITDMDKVVKLDGILHMNKSEESTEPRETATIGEILEYLNKVYAEKTGFEFMHIPSGSIRKWIANHVETEMPKKKIDKARRQRIFELLSKSEVFDHFMQKKYGQVKRYGLEGAESMMVALDHLFKLSSERGVENVVLSMPHRGRLNLATSLLEFAPRRLFHKLAGNSEFPPGIKASGDVLSHIFNDSYLDYGGPNKLQVSLLPNPSHLEAANPVSLGVARAKQMYLYNNITDEGCKLGDRVMSVQLHGDAAFTGQGVVMETLGLSNLPHFGSGGSVHVIVNNQIGYTTPAQNARSTVYTSDVGKMINAPIVHVNGDSPEEVLRAVEIAFAYRDKFRRDVILDLVTFRRWGHNELDEPSFTQPLMYNKIRARKSVPKLYEEHLVAIGDMTEAEIEAKRAEWFEDLEKERSVAGQYVPELDAFKGRWSGLKPPMENESASVEDVSEVMTGVEKEELIKIGEYSVSPSPAVEPHPRLTKFHIQPRLAKLKRGTGIDWATAEALAMGSLLKDGHAVRISGQDVGRGTFSQRHAMFVCQKTEAVDVPLNRLDTPPESKLEVANSHLSEYAVLGFEYGVSISSPNALVIWEAQFGDFNNTAQVIIDTYLASGETKWMRQSGLVMLLPHGYDGAGPEHSSSRTERFLQLSDDPIPTPGVPLTNNINANMSVVFPTTPAQYFHLLRRQLKREFRRPLIIVGPKTLLRLSAATSTLEEMAVGTSFKPVLDDKDLMLLPSSSSTSGNYRDNVTRLVLVSGKFYYELAAHRAKLQSAGSKVALVRLEELTPFPAKQLADLLAKYPNVTDYVWCQEETQNAGAYSFVLPRINALLAPHQGSLRYIGRNPLAAPVTGISSVYKNEQSQIISQAFEGL